MTLEDFKIYFWQYINDTIVSYDDINLNNKDFCDTIAFDCYRLYSQQNVSIDFICKMAENILFAVYRYKPNLGS